MTKRSVKLEDEEVSNVGETSYEEAQEGKFSDEGGNLKDISRDFVEQ